MNAVELR